MEDLNGKAISFADDKGIKQVGTIHWKMGTNTVSILYPPEDPLVSAAKVEFLTDENTLRQKIGQGEWVLID